MTHSSTSAMKQCDALEPYLVHAANTAKGLPRIVPCLAPLDSSELDHDSVKEGGILMCRCFSDKSLPRNNSLA